MNIFEIEGPDGTIFEVEAETIEQAAAAVSGMGSPEKSWGQTLKEFFVGDDDPTTQNLGEKIGSTLNKAGESLTFGLVGDEASAAVESLMPGVNYADRRDHYRQQEEVLERDNPSLALGADVGGAVAGAMLPLGAIGTLGRTAPMWQRLLASGAAGAGMGATYGGMEGEGVEDRLSEARLGGIVGGVAGAAAIPAGSVARRVATSLMRRGPRRAAIRSAQTAAEQRRASGAAYDAFESADVELTPQAISRLRGRVTDRLAREGRSNLPGPMGELTPNARKIADTLAAIDNQAKARVAARQNPRVRFQDFEDIRRGAGEYAQELGPNMRPTRDARLATVAIDEIDAFVGSLNAADVVGDVNAARTALKKARDLWSQSTKTQLVENAINAQDDYLGGSASAIRNRIGSLVRNPQTRRKFSDEELAELRKIIGGNALTRTVRLMGNGIGRQGQMALGAAGGGPLGALAGAVTGEITAEAANRNAVRQAEIARALIASGALKNMPTAPDSVRMLTEALTRRIGAASPQ